MKLVIIWGFSNRQQTNNRLFSLAQLDFKQPGSVSFTLTRQAAVVCS
ncbi:hypothetical protein Spb1_31750 [Planctopirus ephydatiae]|uniref:Uncharacterized protein n=1 Tax=Planctopirus ephydatiae TaxID=2528019 RepID=A0A518GRR7_9PLAN|nr:hypothetical protein Spb1_31750 [Planctopirus ephydatiae]